MSSSTSVINLYKQVIENVIEKMQNEFINAGIDEAVLSDLRQIWLQKLHATRALNSTEYIPEYGAGNPAELEDEDVLYTSTTFPFQPQQSQQQSQQQRQRGQGGGGSRVIPNHQVDGDYSDEEAKDQQQQQQQQQEEETKDDELNSDLDDEEEEDVDAVETDNRLLCQFERVSRSRNRWKCVLTDGIAAINGKDYAFHKAQCDFEF